MGFTLIETIIVLLVLGILSVTMFISTNNVNKRNVSDQSDLLRRDLAHIQMLAIEFGVPLRFNLLYTVQNVCTTSGGVTTCAPMKSNFFYKVTCPSAVANTPCSTKDMDFIDPATQETFNVVIPSALSLSAVDSAGLTAETVDFDSLGRPVSGSTLLATSPVRTFAFTAALKTSYVKLQPITGFAEVSY